MKLNELFQNIKEMQYFDKSLNEDYVTKSFATYMNSLQETNKLFNLTAIVEDEDIVLKHFYDSLYLLKYISLENKIVADVGSGAGFPGLALAIVCKNTKFVLIEPTTKKATYLETVVKLLNLNNVKVLNKRVEDLDKNYKEFFDIVVCRAVAQLSILSELTIPFIKINGYFIPYKGLTVDKELSEAKGAIKILGGKVEKVETYSLPEIKDDKRSLVFIKKVEASPHKYPRIYTLISQKPLK